MASMKVGYLQMHRLYALTTPFVSKISGSIEYLHKEVLQPPEMETVVPPWISDASIERISAAHSWSSLDSERTILFQTEVSHAPVVRYDHGPGIVGPDGFVTERRRLRLSSAFTWNVLTQTLTAAEEIHYVNDKAIRQYFGHWLTDGLAQTKLASNGSYYLSNPASWVHCEQYRSALGLRARDEGYISTDQIITYSDFSQGSLKKSRYSEMKRRLRQVFPSQSNEEKVFLWRGETGVGRQFQDPEDLIEKLQHDGWTILDVASPLPEIVRTLAGAQVVASMEGSHLNHAHFATGPATALIILVPHDIFTAVQVGLVRAVGNHCGFCVLSGSQADGYRLDFSALEQAVQGTYAMTGR